MNERAPDRAGGTTARNPRPRPRRPADEAADPLDLEWNDDAWEPLPKRSGFGRRALTIVGGLAVLALVLGLLAWRWVDHQIHPPGDEGPAVEITIQRGATTDDIATVLAQKKVIGNPTVFRLWLSRQDRGVFKAGIYDFRTRMNYEDVLTTLEGPARASEAFRVTVPPGFTVAQTKDQLLKRVPTFNSAELDRAFDAPETLVRFAPPGTKSREGMLFPDTYNLDEATVGDELALLVRMRKEMEDTVVALNIDERAAALGITPYQALIVASLVEREAKVDADRAKIARVVYNRLQRDMLLEIDAAVLYAVGKANDTGQKLTLGDLASDNPYNVYKFKGLPPSPIASPSKKSIEAALNPADGKWLWYVLTDKSGAHTFAESERDFLAARAICVREKLC